MQYKLGELYGIAALWHAANSNQAQVSPSHSAEVTKFLALPDMRSLSTQSREAHGS